MLQVFAKAAAGLPAPSTRHYLACVRPGQGAKHNNGASGTRKTRAKSTAWMRARDNDEKPKKNHAPVSSFSRAPKSLILR